MAGTGEYTTGFVHDSASSSDKSAGVVALTLFDLRARGLVGDLSMVGTNGTKFPAIREHLETAIASRYNGLSTAFTSFPADTVSRDPRAYVTALDALSPGDCVTIFTPDDSHFEIAEAALQRGLHALIAKPLVQKTHHHQKLMSLAGEKNLLCAMEVHKRWDPIYADARDRARTLGPFSHFNAYMSQPKSQLQTFKSWAGKSSDISFYLNAHHLDLLLWIIGDSFRATSVHAIAATGTAVASGLPTEDSITLCVQFQSLDGERHASALLTSSWIAPKSDVHSQQRFFYQAEKGEITVDQAHRGYTIADDSSGLHSPNPLFMKYTPNSLGEFSGQSGYGYRSIEDFILAARSVNEGKTKAGDWHHRLASAASTLDVTRILEAGRSSLDEHGSLVTLT